ncbi:MAG TPA: SdpI family protein [Gemmataceae bacterium]|nr:SdpI family protein [Gemmataceae bacterium]
MTRWSYVSIALALVAAGGSLYVYLFHYDQLPDQLPVHWGIAGTPDDWMAKGTALVLWPAVVAGVVLLTLVLPWLSPRHFEVEPFRATYGYLMALVAGLLTYMHLVVLWGALWPGFSTERWLFGGLFLLFALMGNVLGRVRRNFWMGVRTPWTLASETVWIQTHRLTAWLFTAFGLAGFVAVLLGVNMLWCFASLIAVALVPVVYSLVFYKRLERQGRV